MKYVKLFENWLNESDSVTTNEEKLGRFENSGYPFIEMIMHLQGKEYKGTGPWVLGKRPLPNLTVEFVGTDSNFKKGWKKSMTIQGLLYNLCRPEWKSVELVYTGNLVTDLQTGGSYVVLKSSTNSAITTIDLPSTLQSGPDVLLNIAKDWSSRNSGKFQKLNDMYANWLNRGEGGEEEDGGGNKSKNRGSSSGDGGGAGRTSSTIGLLTGAQI